MIHKFVGLVVASVIMLMGLVVITPQNAYAATNLSLIHILPKQKILPRRGHLDWHVSSTIILAYALILEAIVHYFHRVLYVLQKHTFLPKSGHQHLELSIVSGL